MPKGVSTAAMTEGAARPERALLGEPAAIERELLDPELGGRAKGGFGDAGTGAVEMVRPSRRVPGVGREEMAEY
jgi:hypothetical protein